MPRYKFSDIAYNITDKKMPEPGDEKTYIGLEHLDPGSLAVTRWGSDVELKGQKLVMKKGDILFGRRNTYLRRAAIAPHDGIFSAHGMIFRPITEHIDPDYFPFFIASDYFIDAAIRISVGSLSPTVNWKTLKELEFDIPELSDQRDHAKLLKTANETKEAYQELINKTEDLVKAKFIEMEDRAEKTKLSDLCLSYGRGKTPKYVEDSNVHVINQACIYWDGLHTENVKYQNPDKFKDENMLKPGDLLLNSTGTGTIGRAHVFDLSDEYIYMADSHVSILRPDKTKILPVVLQHYFYNDYYQSELYRLCVFGSTSQAELSKEALGRMQVPVIEMETQEAFEDFVIQSKKSKQELQEAMESLDVLIRSIVQQDLN